MSKRFKNKICAYCGGVSMTGDHIIAREFFSAHLRDNLPQVPACVPCNKAKSELEHYLVTILASGSEHPSAAAASAKMGARLAKNRRLARELGAGMRELPNGWGLIPVRAEFVDRYLQYVVKGLVFERLNIVVDGRFRVEGSALREGAADGLEQMRAQCGDELLRIEGSYADGGFEYIGYVSGRHIPVSVWRIRLYGQVAMGGAGDDERPGAFEFGAAILPKPPPRPIWRTGWG